jgi:hypothetical protein
MLLVANFPLLMMMMFDQIVYNKWGAKSFRCIGSRINTQTQSNEDMTVGNTRSRNIMHNRGTSIVETKIFILPFGE